MDTFTEKILARARERQRQLQKGSSDEKVTAKVLREANCDLNRAGSKAASQPNLVVATADLIVSPSPHKVSFTTSDPSMNASDFKENNSVGEGNVKKSSLSSSLKTHVVSSSEMISSPMQSQSKLNTLNIQNDNFNMEIKVTSSDHVRLEVAIEEHNHSGDDEDGNRGGDVGAGLRPDAKNRLNRLGQLYAGGGDDAGISSPIHRTEAKFDAVTVNDDMQDVSSSSSVVEQPPPSQKGRKGLSKLNELARNIDQWEDDLSTSSRKEQPTLAHKPVLRKSVKQTPAPPRPSLVVPTTTASPNGGGGGATKGKKKAPSPPDVVLSKSVQETATKTVIPTNKVGSLVSKIDGTAKKLVMDDEDDGVVEKTNSVGSTTTTKQLDWDQKVLNNLESQGFSRTTSNTRLVYNYQNSLENNNKNNNSDQTTKSKQQSDEEEQQQTGGKSPTLKIKTRPVTTTTTTMVAEKAALFESSGSSNSPLVVKVKDPALLTVSERKALFEKNKGTALIPKAAFAMSAPSTKSVGAAATTTTKQQGTTKMGIVDTTSIAPPSLKATGIANKVAALFDRKATISQEQIATGMREQKQKEIDMLLNRFNKNKDKVVGGGGGIDDIIIEEEDEDDDDASETTAMIVRRRDDNNKKGVVVVQSSSGKMLLPPPPPPPPQLLVQRNDNKKRCGTNKGDSPKVAAVLSEVKRIKVAPQKKAGRLYPSLSDIEAVTETETETEDQHSEEENNSSFGRDDDSVADSDSDGNTSFGRDILQAVCKNQTPQKRSLVASEAASTDSSDLSNILDNMDDDYIDEALAYNASISNGPTPPKHGRHSPSYLNSTSFNYKSTKADLATTDHFKSPMKMMSTTARPSIGGEGLPAYVMDGDNLLPLKHTVSVYRRQQTQQATTPVRQISRQPIVSDEETVKNGSENGQIVAEKIRELHDEVSLQEKIIAQTSQALNLCNSTPEFMGSTEQVEAERVLLVATHRRQAAQHELQRLQVEGTLRPQGQQQHSKNVPLEKGTLTITKIVLPLKHKYVTALAAAGGKGHHVVCLIKCGSQVVPTRLVSTTATNIKNPDTDLNIPGTITLTNIYSDFTITFEVYCLQAQEEILSHELKYHINSKKSSTKLLTPKKSKQDSRLTRPIKESPGGPQVVRSPTFALMGYVVFSVRAINKKHWALNNSPPMSPLEGSLEMRIDCELDVSVEHRGFLTMFEDVSGFGAWHRRWCLLQGDTFSYWKYPDDERKMAPIDSISLRNCVTKHVGPVSRDICARLHTLLIERERDAYPHDRDTLVMVCRGDKTVIRHLLSADTKEERIEWCNKFNSAFTALNMWGK